MNDSYVPTRHVWRNTACHLNAALDRLDAESIDALIIKSLPKDDNRVAIIADRARRAG